VPRTDVSEIWPWTHKGKIKKEASARRYAEGLRPFIRLCEHRALDSFTRTEARALAKGFANHTCQATHRLFENAIDEELIAGRNPSPGSASAQLVASRTPTSRSSAQSSTSPLKSAALRARADDYGLILRLAIVLAGTTVMRPGEIFAADRRLIVRVPSGWRWTSAGRSTTSAS
jgi:hypothetical protein